MQDRYAGDTPDFGKYSLLQHIQNRTGLRLGINWYRTRPDEVDFLENNDGQTRHHTRLPQLFEAASPYIYASLRPFENDLFRCLENIEQADILAAGTCFFNEFLSFGRPRVACASQIRKHWFDRSLARLKDCHVVFCDPDTGPASRSMLRKAHTRKGPKYSYPNEISAYLNQGQSVIVVRFIRQYRGGVEVAVRDTFKLLETHNAVGKVGFALEFPSGKNSTYFVLPTQTHEHALRIAIDALQDCPLGRLFKQHEAYIAGS